MLLRQIRYFVTVVDCHSFTEAAMRCYISQSAISQQIQALEEGLGIQLLLREGRSFSVTPEGELFYKKGKILLEQAEALQEEMALLAKKAGQHIAIGLPADYAGLALYHAIDSFSEQHPDVELDLMHGSYDELQAALKDGTLDLAISERQNSAGGGKAKNKYLFQAQCFVEVPARTPLDKEKQLTEAVFNERPCVLLCKPNYRYLATERFRERFGGTAKYIFAGSLEEGRTKMFTGKGLLPLYAEKGGLRFRNEAFQNRALYIDGVQDTQDYFAYWRLNNASKHLPLLIKSLQEAFAE